MVEAAPDPNCPGCQTLLAKIALLEARVRANSSNSSRPPSSDPPWSGPSRSTPPSGRKRGGQPGHEKSERPLLPPEDVDRLELCKPSTCEHCGGGLFGKDLSPHRHQVTELPPTKPVVVEYQLHTLACRACGRRTRAELPAGVPSGAFGPRLQALVVLHTGVYRVSRRNVQRLMADAYGVELSLGAISNIEKTFAEALAGPHNQALEKVQRSAVTHLDETSWRERNRLAWLWTAVTKDVSVFLIRPTRGAAVAKELIGERFDGVAVSDRWSGYDWIDIEQRQACWAHLLRDFRKIAESQGLTSWIGESLEKRARELFALWHRVRDGTLQRVTFRRHVRRIRRGMVDLLQLGAASDGWRVPGLCRGILELEQAMWTFVRREGIEPTNNDAERALRPGVIWRKTCLGTQSDRGSRFAERLMSCVTTLRRNERNVLDYLCAVSGAALRDDPIPSFVN